ncbi:ZP domain-containing protein-like [Lytechinus variegatus]|uniref:ZP domain-containing protein-like n=1 Tax=Lytechinus variegatus TaxID=7654 RepID=UPI001BB0DCA5|nr:ZP domain-containing protein-like [Lytechinus variegatus]
MERRNIRSAAGIRYPLSLHVDFDPSTTTACFRSARSWPGRTLLLLYINDILHNVQSTMRLFADDGVIYHEIKHCVDQQILQNDLQQLSSCGKPPDIPNASEPGITHAHLGDQYTYECLQGYSPSLDGTLTIVCERDENNNYSWTSVTGRCDRDKCATPPPINLAVSPPNVEYHVGDTYMYQCAPLFGPSSEGSLVISCVTDHDTGAAIWTDVTGSCVQPCTAPCNNEGTCEEGSCICPDGFGGPTCEEEYTSVTCESDSMTVVLNKDLFDGIALADVNFHDHSCESEPDVDDDHVTLSTGYDKCGTTKEEDDTTITFSNTITYYLPEAIPNSEITREYQKQLEVSCCLDKTSQVDQSFTPKLGKIKFSDKGSGHFHLDITRFTNDYFYEPAHDNDEVSQDNPLYFQVQLDSVDEVGMFIERCWATAGAGHDSNPRHDLFTERCTFDDDTVQVSFPGNGHLENFWFNSFAFVGDHDMVYIHCEVMVCETKEAGLKRKCPGDSSDRKRRSSSFLSTQTISSAPIRVRRSTNDMATNDLSAYNSFGVFIIGMVATMVAITILMGVVKLVGRPTGNSFKRVPTASMEGI